MRKWRVGDHFLLNDPENSRYWLCKINAFVWYGQKKETYVEIFDLAENKTFEWPLKYMKGDKKLSKKEVMRYLLES